MSVGCRGGGCGVCKVKILKGTYILGKMSRVHVNEEEIKQGVALACRIYPTSTLLVEPIGKLLI
jgi:ferredoxin